MNLANINWSLCNQQRQHISQKKKKLLKGWNVPLICVSIFNSYKLMLLITKYHKKESISHGKFPSFEEIEDKDLHLWGNVPPKSPHCYALVTPSCVPTPTPYADPFLLLFLFLTTTHLYRWLTLSYDSLWFTLVMTPFYFWLTNSSINTRTIYL